MTVQNLSLSEQKALMIVGVDSLIGHLVDAGALEKRYRKLVPESMRDSNLSIPEAESIYKLILALAEEGVKDPQKTGPLAGLLLVAESATERLMNLTKWVAQGY